MRVWRWMGRLTVFILWSVLISWVSGCATEQTDPYFMKTRTSANVYVRQMPPELRKVAVMPFKAPTELIGSSVSDLFVTEILRTGYYNLVERSQMGKVLNEAELSASGISESRAMEVGNMLGADCVLIGTVDEYAMAAQRGKTFAVAGISMRMIECSSGKIVWSADLASRADSSDCTLPQHARKVVHEITAGLYKEWVKRIGTSRREKELESVQSRRDAGPAGDAAKKEAAVMAVGAAPQEASLKPVVIDEPPPQPCEFKLSDMGLREVAATWNQSINADKYEIERCISPTGTFEVIYTGRRVNYTDRGQHNNQPLEDAKTYYYRVTAVSATGKKSPPTPVKESMTAFPPEAVTDVTVLSDMVRCVPVIWKRTADENVTGFEILRATLPEGPFEMISLVKGNASTNFIDGGSEPGNLLDHATYHYRILAVNRVGAKSIKATDVTAVTREAPPAVTGLQASGACPREIPLAWSRSLDEKVAGYCIQRAEADSETFDDIKNLQGIDVTNYMDRGGVSASKKLAGLKDSTSYKYRIQAYNIAKVSSPWSVAVSAVTKPAPAKPLLPDAISGIARKVELEWKPSPEKDIAEYVLEYHEKGSTRFKELARASATSFNHAPLKDGATYIYRIKAVDRDLLESLFSDEAMATTKPLPGSPTELAMEAAQSGGFKLKWLAPAQKDIATYRLYKSGLFSNKLLKETELAECLLESAVIGKSAKVSVSAVDRDGLESAKSSEIELKQQ